MIESNNDRRRTPGWAVVAQALRNGFIRMRAASLPLVMLAASPPCRAQSITVHPADYGQHISMMGGDMERSGRNFHQAGNPQDVVNWCVRDIPFNTWRVGYDKAQEMVEGSRDFSVYDSDVLAMRMIRQTNPDIRFFATMESDYNGYNQGNRNNLPTFIYDYAYVNGQATGTKSFDAEKYGVFLADYVEYMDDQGVPIDYISTSKEWFQVVNATRAKAAIESMISELNARQVAVPGIIDACTWSISQGVSTVNNYNSNDITRYVHGFSTHDYWSGETKNWSDFVSAANAAGKPAYADETGHGGGGFITTGEVAIQNTIGNYVKKCSYYEQGIQGECIFELWPRGYNEINNNGFYAKPIFFDGGSWAYRMRSYHVMKKFATGAVDSDYVGSSTDSMPDVHTMAFRKGDQVTLWVINQGVTGYDDVPLALVGDVPGDHLHATSWTANTSITGENSAQFAEAGRFTTSIPAESLNCFIFDVGPVINPLSHAESFESGLGAWVQSADDDYDWTVHSGGTPTASAGPDGASDGSSYLYAEGHHGLGSYRTASIEAAVDFSGVKSATLIFDYHMHGVFIDYLALDVYDGTAWTNDVWIRNGQQHASSEAPWSSAQVNLSGYAGNPDVMLRFRTANTAWNSADPAIDNIRLQGTAGPMLVGYDFDGASADPTQVLSPYVSASALTSPMDIGFPTTIGDTSGVDAEGMPLGHAGDLGTIGISVDDATAGSFFGSVANDHYLTFTVTPDPRVTLDLEAITFKASTSTADSVDQYAVTDASGVQVGDTVHVTTTGQVGTYQAASIDLSASGFHGLTEPVTFRIHAWGRGTVSTNGTLAMIDNVTLHGSASFNTSPEADAQSVSTPKNTPIAITLTGTDMEHDPLSYAVVSPPAHGTLSGTAPHLTYTPATDYLGPDSFTFTADDGRSTSAATTVSILAGVAPDVVAGYDFDDGSGNATTAVTVKDDKVSASDFGIGAGLVERIESTGNALAEDTDAEGNLFGTANPLSFGGTQSNFGFVDMNNADNLALAISEDDYMVFTITPETDAEMDLTRFTFRMRTNSTNNSAERWALFSSVGGFAENAKIAGGRTTVEGAYVDIVVDLPAADFDGLVEATTFRLYIYGGNEPWSGATVFDKLVVHGEVGLIGEQDPFSEWAAGYGLTGNEALPDADVENGGTGDGYSNLLEFALGMDPTVWDAGSRESCGSSGDDGNRYFEYLFHRRTDRAELGISYQVLDSPTLQHFGSSVDAWDEVIVGPAVDGFEPVTTRYLIGASANFLQLRVLQE
ncbi:MAG: Ig-like domain-containing protein [Verrucomicrobiota bacterium JB025]|nr:Ig-like domain-containing protein [Verrucomicrobiota bacterium JB025]